MSFSLKTWALRLINAEAYTTMESREYVLRPEIAAAAETVLDSLRMPYFPILTYLANELSTAGGLVPYSTVAALNSTQSENFGGLHLIDNTPAPSLLEDEILINQWAAEDLQAAAGDTINMTYFAVGAQDQLYTTGSLFRVKGIVAMRGIGTDPAFTPEYPGIHDADNILDWDPPFPMKLNLIRPKDEDYWDEYRGTPKAFVSLETGQKLWKSRFGDLTAMRLGIAPGLNLEASVEVFSNALLQKLPPESSGFVFQPLKQQGLEASAGATDFSSLFIGFSLFLIISSALLVGLLFRLGVEQRVGEIGVLLSTGYTMRRIRRMFFKEAMLIAGLGSLIGLSGAVVYAWLLMAGLRTLWIGATGTNFLFLHVTAASLIIGLFISLFVVLFATRRSLQQLVKVPTPALLAGTTAINKESAGKTARLVAFLSLLLAAALLLYALSAGITAAAALFFPIGACLLITGLALFAAWFRGHHQSGNAKVSLPLLAIRNNARKPGRSMLSIALVACAVFMIVSVGANRRDYNKDTTHKNSG